MKFRHDRSSVTVMVSPKELAPRAVYGTIALDAFAQYTAATKILSRTNTKIGLAHAVYTAPDQTQDPAFPSKELYQVLADYISEDEPIFQVVPKDARQDAVFAMIRKVHQYVYTRMDKKVTEKDIYLEFVTAYNDPEIKTIRLCLPNCVSVGVDSTVVRVFSDSPSTPSEPIRLTRRLTTMVKLKETEEIGRVMSFVASAKDDGCFEVLQVTLKVGDRLMQMNPAEIENV